MIDKQKLIKWLTEDGYSVKDATKDINEAEIIEINTPVNMIIYNNGVKDVITERNGEIIHLNPHLFIDAN